MSRVLNPVYSSTSDGSDITLCRILEQLGTLTTAITRSANQQPYTHVSTASDNATVIKASAGTVFNLAYTNMGNADVFLKFYNKATTPNTATDIPVFIWPASKLSHDSIAFGINPMSFTIGIAFAMTSTINDGGPISANELVLNLSYV